MKIALSIPGYPNIDTGNPSLTPLPQGVPTGGLFTGAGQSIVVTAIEILVAGAFLFSLFSLMRGGINMITSGGDKERFAKGRERLRYAIIGLIIIFMSIAALSLIGNFFGANLLLISE